MSSPVYILLERELTGKCPVTPATSEYVWWAFNVVGELAYSWYNSPIKYMWQVCYRCEDQGYMGIKS